MGQRDERIGDHRGRRYIGVVLSGFRISDPMAKSYRALRPKANQRLPLSMEKRVVLWSFHPPTLHVDFLIVRSWTFPQRRTGCGNGDIVPGKCQRKSNFRYIRVGRGTRFMRLRMWEWSRGWVSEAGRVEISIWRCGGWDLGRLRSR